MNRRNAFTSIELMIVLVVVAIISVVAMSDGDTNEKEQARQASLRFSGDVAYARSLAIARPDDPVIIKVDEEGNRYWLAHASAPATPITHHRTGEPYIVSFGEGGTTAFDEVEIAGCDFDGGDVLTFDGVGDVEQGDAAVLYLSACGAASQVVVGSQKTSCFDFDYEQLPKAGFEDEDGGVGGGGMPPPGSPPPDMQL